MKLPQKISLYWRLMASYLLVIAVGSVTLFVANGAIGPIFFDRHVAGMMANTMHDITPDMLMNSMSADIDAAYRTAFSQSLFWALTVSGVVAGTVGLYVTNRVVAPLKQMQKASNYIANGQYQKRLNAQAPGEIGDLALAFNAMAESLEQTEQQRVELLANVAHEFKTPLSSLHGYIEGLEDGLFSPDAETLSACQRQISRLEQLVADLSLLSRVEAGQVQVSPRPTGVVNLLKQVEASFKPQFAKKGVSLSLEPTPKDLQVLADPQRSGQVLTNLVGNALRHTPAGGEVRLSVREQSRNEVLFEISDNGEGISAEELPYIFTRFYRADKARSRDKGSGSGIGLTIAKHLVEMQGGHIDVASELGKGSRFWFTLPRPLA